MLDEAYAGPCSIARDPRPSRKVVSTLQVSRFMARQVHDGIPGNAAVGSTPNGQPPEFTHLEGSGQVEPGSLTQLGPVSPRWGLESPITSPGARGSLPCSPGSASLGG